MRLMGTLLAALVLAVTGCSSDDDAAPSTSAAAATTVARSNDDVAACAIFDSESSSAREDLERLFAEGQASGMEISFAATDIRDAASNALQRADAAALIEPLAEARARMEAAWQASGEPADSWPDLRQGRTAVAEVLAWCAES